MNTFSDHYRHIVQQNPFKIDSKFFGRTGTEHVKLARKLGIKPNSPKAIRYMEHDDDDLSRPMAFPNNEEDVEIMRQMLEAKATRKHKAPVSVEFFVGSSIKKYRNNMAEYELAEKMNAIFKDKERPKPCLLSFSNDSPFSEGYHKMTFLLCQMKNEDGEKKNYVLLTAWQANRDNSDASIDQYLHENQGCLGFEYLPPAMNAIHLKTIGCATAGLQNGMYLLERNPKKTGKPNFEIALEQSKAFPATSPRNRTRSFYPPPIKFFALSQASALECAEEQDTFYPNKFPYTYEQVAEVDKKKNKHCLYLPKTDRQVKDDPRLQTREIRTLCPYSHCPVEYNNEDYCPRLDLKLWETGIQWKIEFDDFKARRKQSGTIPHTASKTHEPTPNENSGIKTSQGNEIETSTTVDEFKRQYRQIIAGEAFDENQEKAEVS